MHERSEQFPIGGYHSCYLRVDLTDVQAKAVAINESDLRNFIGGSGLGVSILTNELQATVDPLSAESGIGFIFSPLVGSPITTSAKFAVVTKSPLTNRFNDALASSQFAISGKQTGFDALYLTGRAAQFSVVLIDDGQVQLESAEAIRGCGCRDTDRWLQKQFPGYRFAVIGPAGENLVRYATISHDQRHAGRGGSGAVLGAKNVKAIGVRGSKQCRWHDPKGLLEKAKELSARSMGPATEKYRELGTATNLLVFNRLSALPTRNFQTNHFESAERISPETLSTSRKRTRAYCAACTIGCEHIYELQSQNDKVRLEYENLFALGSLCEIDDPEVVLKASILCDDFGLDTISAGGTIAFAMECVERGLLDLPWLRFGDGDALLRCINDIALRKDLGHRLAEGSRRMALEIGSSALDFAPQVKGLEIPGYDPRSLQTMALGFAVNARGADHNRSGAYEADFSGAADRFHPDENSVRLAIESEDRSALIDSLIICKFLRGIFGDLYRESAELLNLVTGWDLNSRELLMAAKNIVNAKKQFNILAGWTPDEDTLPKRFFDNDHQTNQTIDKSRFQELIRAYNRERGWTHDGYLK